MTGSSALIMSLLMFAGFALAVGGAYMIGKRKDRRRGLLMLVAALVMWGNVAILTL
jgi:hypothetical protein